MLEKVQTNFQKYGKILDPNGKMASIFTDGKNSFKFTDIDKAPFSGIGGQSRNALGKALADAGELATVMSLRKKIETAKDTKQSIFEKDPEAFSDWFKTFQLTKPAVIKIVGSLNTYDIIHDATDKSAFTTTIEKFLKKVGISKKDSWNPADIFIVKKDKRKEITDALDKMVKTYTASEGLLNMVNDKIYKLYKDGKMYPISLKQITSDKANVD